MTPRIKEGKLLLGMKTTCKQPRGSGLCLAASVATLLGHSQHLFMRWTGIWTLSGKVKDIGDKHRSQFDDPRFMPLKSAYQVLCEQRLGLGAWLSAGDPVKLEEDDRITVDIPLDAQPALVTVKSDNYPGCTHSVVWDNEAMMVRDPSRMVRDLQPLEWYEVLEWFPVYLLGDD